MKYLKLITFLFFLLGNSNSVMAEEKPSLDEVTLTMSILEKIEGGVILGVELKNTSDSPIDFIKSQKENPIDIRVYDESLNIVNIKEILSKDSARHNRIEEVELVSGKSTSYRITFIFDQNNLSNMSKKKKYFLSAIYPFIRKIKGKFKVDLLVSPKIELPKFKEQLNAEN
jgi:hypothetical protein